jgi:hypothetical protein
MSGIQVNPVTNIEINNAYNHYKSSENDHIHLYHLNDIHAHHLYYYVDRENNRYIIKITLLANLITIHSLAIINDDITIINEHVPVSYTVNGFITMINDACTLEYLDRTYIGPIEPVHEREAMPNINLLNISPHYGILNTRTYNTMNSYIMQTGFNTYHNIQTSNASTLSSNASTLSSVASSLPFVESILPVTTSALTSIDEMIDESQSYVDDLTCGICMTNKKQISLDCGHLFCTSCSKKLVGKCFICKKPYKDLRKIFI